MWMFVASLQEISTSKICWLLGHGASLAVKRGMGSTGGKDWYFGRLKSLNEKMDPMKYTLEYWKWTFWTQNRGGWKMFFSRSFSALHHFKQKQKGEKFMTYWLSSMNCWEKKEFTEISRYITSSPLIHHSPYHHPRKKKRAKTAISKKKISSSSSSSSSSMAWFT